MINAANLFTGQSGFEEFDNVVKLHESRKRGKYNKQIATDDYIQRFLIFIQLISPYTYINEIYNHIAVNYVPLPLFSKEETAFLFNGLSVTLSVYDAEMYDYYDYTTGDIEILEHCQGEEFTVFQAELIGTDYMTVQDRIDLHLKLIAYLEDGVELKQAVALVQPEIERIKKIYDEEKAAREKSDIFKRV